MPPFKILCVEDHKSSLLVLERMLMSRAVTVLQATNAEEGLVIAREQKPDLILMDLMLPGMDGLTATRQLKADPEMNHIPIIAISAAERPSPQDCLDAGCVDHIAKPVTMAKLTQALNPYFKVPNK
ncbi:MAG: response regulator [Chloroflexi bacterium]|nr:response regulator [Chloroflexota bacterium]